MKKNNNNDRLISMNFFKEKKNSVKNILIIVVVLFVVAIIPLKYYFPNDSDNLNGSHQWLTASSLKYLNNWLKDGLIKDKCMLYEDFNSIEFEKSQRTIYVSYPPGAILPLYIIAKGLGYKEVSVSFIKHFVQFEYYLSILFLGLIFYFCLEFLNINSRLLKIIIPISFACLWAFLPNNFYYMRNVYFSDQGVILISLIFFFIEILLYNLQQKTWRSALHFISNFVLFIGILTDYYFVCIFLVAFCFRIISFFELYPPHIARQKIFENTFTMFLSVIAAMALYCIQIYNIPNGFEELMARFIERSSSGESIGGLGFLYVHFRNGFSIIFLPILICIVLLCLSVLFKRNINKKVKTLVRWLSIIVFPSVLHTALLRNHSIMHEFSMLKYNIVFVFILFSIIVWLIIYQENKIDYSLKNQKIYAVLLGIVVLFSFTKLINYDKSFYSQRIEPFDYSIANFVKVNSTYFDVVYSPNYEININPPQNLSISEKRVYKVSSLDDIPFNSLNDNAIINILISKNTLINEKWNKLINEKCFSVKLDNYYLFKLNKDVFPSIIGRNMQ